MRTDSEIERDVRDELKWDPDLDASDIAVSVKDGVVTLAGFTSSYPERLEAEAAAKRVAGVHAVANDIEVRLPAIDQRPDPDIARDAIAALKAKLRISYDRIKVIVRDGWITLEGAVEWQYQRVRGVKGVTNVITVKPMLESSELKRKIQEAFMRNAELDTNRITVEANGSEVILKGAVRSWIEREEAERVAWSAPGVTKVEDRIVVSP
jgi:osmotically-inducible protein OsmY